MLSFRAGVDLERFLHSFCKKAQGKGNSWGLTKHSLICPWKIHRGLYMSFPTQREA